jgi:hypothetical protein
LKVGPVDVPIAVTRELCPMSAQNAFEDPLWAERAKTSH